MTLCHHIEVDIVPSFDIDAHELIVQKSQSQVAAAESAKNNHTNLHFDKELFLEHLSPYSRNFPGIDN